MLPDLHGRKGLTERCEALAEILEVLEFLSAEQPPGASDASAWERAFRQWTPVLRRITRACGAGLAGEEDVLQEVWLEIIQGLPRLAREGRLAEIAPWLYHVVRRKAVDALRRIARRHADSLSAAIANGREPADKSPGPDVELERRGERQCLRAALEELRQEAGETNARVIELRFLEGQTAGQVGLALGLSEKSVWKRQRQAPAKLRSLLKPHAVEELR